MSSLEETLDHCLKRLASGEVTLEECLASHPEYANELPQLLAVVEHLGQGQTVQPTKTFKLNTRAQLIVYANANPRQPSFWRQVSGLFLFRFLPVGPMLKVVLSLIVVAALCLTTGTMLAQAADPGDTLYNWRLTSEEVLQAIYPGSSVDVFIAERRVEDLIESAGEPDLEKLVLPSYQQSLGRLSQYLDSDSKEIVVQSLIEQRANLIRVDLPVPQELDALLSTSDLQGMDTQGQQQRQGTPQPLETDIQLGHETVALGDGFITYSIVITNQGPVSPVTTTVINTLSPGEFLVRTEGATCETADKVVTCTVDDLTIGMAREITVTTQIASCYAGTVTNTATIAETRHRNLGIVANLNPDAQVVLENSTTWPFPMYREVAYVQSNGETHDLNLLSGAPKASYPLHVRAAAPAWSPDGTQLAFFGEAGISNLGDIYAKGNGLWIIDVGEGQEQNPRQLISQDHIKNIVWSLDGEKLAFEVGEPGLPHEVVVVDASDGQEVSRFPGEHPAWSQDSQTLVIKGCYPQCGLWQFNLDGSRETQLTYGETDSYPAFSPTGSPLAFSSRRDGDWEIYLLSMTDNQLRRLTNRPGTDTTPVFGPCGHDIYLRSDHTGDWHITVMKLDGTGEEMVQEGVGQSDDWGLARPAVR